MPSLHRIRRKELRFVDGTSPIRLMYSRRFIFRHGHSEESIKQSGHPLLDSRKHRLDDPLVVPWFYKWEVRNSTMCGYDQISTPIETRNSRQGLICIVCSYSHHVLTVQIIGCIKCRWKNPLYRGKQSLNTSYHSDHDITEFDGEDLSLSIEDLQSSQSMIVANCFQQFTVHACVIQNVHILCTRKAIPEGKTDVETMLALVSVWTTPTRARKIVSSLQKHLTATNAIVTRFRASIIYSLTNDDCAWPVVEWTENDDTEAIAIFYIDEEAPSEVCSWLMHYGVGIVGDSPKSLRWEKTYISWCVGDMEHLRSLFEAAQQLLGVLKWSVKDMLQLYCKRDLSNLSKEEYLIPLLA